MTSSCSHYAGMLEVVQNLYLLPAPPFLHLCCTYLKPPLKAYFLCTVLFFLFSVFTTFYFSTSMAAYCFLNDYHIHLYMFSEPLLYCHLKIMHHKICIALWLSLCFVCVHTRVWGRLQKYYTEYNLKAKSLLKVFLQANIPFYCLIFNSCVLK